MLVGDWSGPLGTLTARLRTSTGLTQEQLAERAGLSVRAISSIECGVRHPRRFTIERIGVALGLPDDERAALLNLAARRRLPEFARAPSILGPADFPLIGRESEQDAVYELIRGSGPGALAIAGEPGIGKSRLLAEAVAIATRQGVPVLTGVCRRGADPYAPIADALADYLIPHRGALAATLARSNPGLAMLLPEVLDVAELTGAPAPDRPAPERSAPGQLASDRRVPRARAPVGQERRLVFAAVAHALMTIADDRRVLLVLDDMQWAGADTADLITHVVRLSGGRVRVILACRVGELESTSRLAATLADLARIREASRLGLAPLSGVAARQLAEAVGAARLASERVEQILRWAGGLPLFIIELVAAALSGADAVPGALQLAVAQQVAVLPAPARAALRQIAAIGGEVPIDRLTRGDRAADAVVDLLEAPCRHGILDETTNGYRFRFPLMRELLLAGLGPNRRHLWRSVAAT